MWKFGADAFDDGRVAFLREVSLATLAFDVEPPTPHIVRIVDG